MEIKDLLEINKKLGLSYCMNLEEVYKDVLGIFIEQCDEYFPKIEKCFEEKDWNNYAIIAHAIKTNALNIGASNFSNLSLSHEMAGKNKDGEYIEKEYKEYIGILKQLVEKVKGML